MLTSIGRQKEDLVKKVGDRHIHIKWEHECSCEHMDTMWESPNVLNFWYESSLTMVVLDPDGGHD